MPLINCPDCGSEVSDRANACIKCGCPLVSGKSLNKVQIKFTMPITNGFIAIGGLAIIDRKTNDMLWEGKMGQVAVFEIDESKDVLIKFPKMCNPISTTISPGTKYAVTQDRGIHWYATFNISEVDMIDSD